MTTGTTFKLKLSYKTPQAVDDEADGYEDLVGYVSIADLLANDLGGSAKAFYGIDQDDPRIASVEGVSALGARLTVDPMSGQIIYDPTQAVDSVIQSLGMGETVEDSFTYTIRLSNGALSTATVTVTVTGMNELPYLTALPGDTVFAELTETDAGLSASGTVSLIDPDSSDAITIDVLSVKAFLTEEAPSGETLVGTGGLSDAELAALGLDREELLGFFTVRPTDGTTYLHDGSAGTVTWTFASGEDAFDFLDEGEMLTLYYNSIRPMDGHGPNFTGDGGILIRINGTAEGATVTLTADDFGL